MATQCTEKYILGAKKFSGSMMSFGDYITAEMEQLTNAITNLWSRVLPEKLIVP
jgi:hypothetical protein